MGIADVRARFGTPEEFIDGLKRSLLTHGVPQARLALEAGVCPTQVSRWFSGRVKPSLETMLKLDDALTRILYPAAQ